MTSPDPHLSRRDAERLLDDPAASGNALGTALTAASDPAHPAELRGEAAAVAAFHAARLAPPPTTRSHYVSPSRLGGRAATRFVVAGGAALALATGGIAIATGAHLPGLPADGARAVASSSDQQPSTPDPRRTKPPTAKKHAPRSDQGTSKGTSKGTASPGSQETSPETGTSPEGLTSAHPTPQTTRLLEEVCRGVLDRNPQAQQRRSRPDGDHDEVLATLMDLAGGHDGVVDYCVVFLGTLPAAEEDRQGDRDWDHHWDHHDGDHDWDHHGDGDHSEGDRHMTPG